MFLLISTAGLITALALFTILYEEADHGHITAEAAAAIFLPSYVVIVGMGMWLFKKVGLPPVTAQTEKLQATLDHQLDINRRQADFLVHVHHELRTPVTVVLGTTQLLAKHGDQLDLSAREQLREAAYRSAQSLSDLVHDLTEGVDEALPGLAVAQDVIAGRRRDAPLRTSHRRSDAVEGVSEPRTRGGARGSTAPSARTAVGSGVGRTGDRGATNLATYGVGSARGWTPTWTLAAATVSGSEMGKEAP